MSAARSNLSARIDRIISNIPPSSPPRRWVRVIAAALLIPLFTIAATNLEAPRAATPGPVSDDPSAPKVIDFGDLKNLEQFYPPAAKVAGKETTVTVGVTLSPEGTVLDAYIVDPDPANLEWGFEEPAVQIVRTLKFSNPRGVMTQSKVRVKFALDKQSRENIKTPTPDASWTTTFPQN